MMIKEKILAVPEGETVYLPSRDMRAVVGVLTNHPTETNIACAEEILLTGACRSLYGRSIVFTPEGVIGAPVLAPLSVPSARISEASISVAYVAPASIAEEER